MPVVDHLFRTFKKLAPALSIGRNYRDMIHNSNVTETFNLVVVICKDLVLVFDKENEHATEFTVHMNQTLKTWLGVNCREPKPHERAGFDVEPPNTVIVVTPNVLKHEQALEPIFVSYGTGLNALLVAGGNGKRNFGDRYPENVPKFTSDDLPLFQGIIGELFPGVKPPPSDYGPLVAKIEDIAVERGLQPTEKFFGKVIQLWETVMVRHRLMTVGIPPCGKTNVKDVLADTLAAVADGGDMFMPVTQYVMNPKSITQGQLYGESDLNTQDECGFVSEGFHLFSTRFGPQTKKRDAERRDTGHRTDTEPHWFFFTVGKKFFFN